MSDPFRSTSCAQCGSLGALPSFCVRCGSARCVRCAHGDVCTHCIANAFEILRASTRGESLESSPKRPPAQPHSRSTPLVTLALCASIAALALSFAANADMRELRSLAARRSPVQRHPPLALPVPPRLVITSPVISPACAPDAATPAPTVAPSGTPSLLISVAHGSHDPLRLLVLASRMASSGLDLTVIRVRLSNPTVAAIDRELSPAGFRASPWVRDGVPVGLRFDTIARDSLFAQLGLRDGDVLTSINGYAVPSAAPELPLRLRSRPGLAVTELIRGQRHMVIAVAWRASAAVRPGPSVASRRASGTRVARNR